MKTSFILSARQHVSTNSLLVVLLFLLFSVTSLSSLSAQKDKEKPQESDVPDFFTHKNKNNIPGNIRRQMVNFENNVSILECHYVEITDFVTKNKKGWLKFNMPNNKNNMLKTQNVSYEKGKIKYWAGKDSNNVESAFLTFVDEGCRGFVRKDGIEYEIYPLGKNFHAMLRKAPLPNEECGLEHKKTGLKVRSESQPPQEHNTEPTELKNIPKQNKDDVFRIEPCNATGDQNIRILFYFTPNAADAVPGGDVRAVAENSVNQINNALAASGIGFPQVQLIDVLPFPLRFNNFNNGNGFQNIQNDLIAMRGVEEVLTQRNNLNADVVCFLTVGNYGTITGSVEDDPANPTNPITQYPRNNRSFFISLPNTADQAGIFTVAHELGHLFGARHQRSAVFSGGDDFGTFAHGFSWETRLNCKFRAFGICFSYNYDRRCSILHIRGRTSGSEPYVRTLQYSNPFINQPGTPTATGTSNDNNARQISEQFTTIANFEQDGVNLPPFNVQIEAPFSASEFSGYCLEAVIQCGQAPFNVQWRWSFDGFNFFVLGNTENICHFAEEAGTTKFYELTVTDALGNVRQTFGSVNSFGSGLLLLRNSDNNGGSPAVTDKIVYPNPTTDIINFTFSLDQDDTYHIRLVDLSGRVVKQVKNDKYVKGSSENISFSVQDVPNGLYFLKISGAMDYHTEKVVINH